MWLLARRLGPIAVKIAEATAALAAEAVESSQLDAECQGGRVPVRTRAIPDSPVFQPGHEPERMLSMRLPGFTAIASTYQRAGGHQATSRNNAARRNADVRPAMPNNGGDAGTSTDDLTQQGYHCEVVSAGFVECTKEGSPTYWCTSGVCVQQLRVNRPPFGTTVGLGGFLPR